ncbi:MAG: hypothetical protein AB7I25_08495 [Vicinamibacterales bacterium]
MLRRTRLPWLMAASLLVAAADAYAQLAPAGSARPAAALAAPDAHRDTGPDAAQPEDAEPGIPVPNSTKLRVRAAFMAGYGKDGANATLGFENQGRVGYAIVTLEGRPHDRVFYRVSMNPVNERDPKPGCGAPGYFFPNDPAFLYAGVPGPNVPCDPKDGHRRVDAYRGIALDVVPQQGAIREAFVDLRATDTFSVRFGRMLLPLGLDWQEAGSMTAKDAARIQRINAETNFGLMFAYTWPVATGRTRPLFGATLSAFLGEGNRWFDYDYFYFEDGTLDANSALSALASASFAPADTLEFRAAVKKGFTGSKVERLPSYWASKRNDDAVTASVAYTPIPYLRLMGEWARYTWGPTESSAELVGVSWADITKQGYWFSAQGHWPLTPAATVGASVTREQVDRADSLVQYLAANGLYGVTTGRKDELTAVRFHLDLWKQVRIGFYKTFDRNPFPQISGIHPLVGPNHDSLFSTEKYGLVVRLTVD